jgi:hypothetical protein
MATTSTGYLPMYCLDRIDLAKLNGDKVLCFVIQPTSDDSEFDKTVEAQISKKKAAGV